MAVRLCRLDLVHYGTRADAEEIRDTAVAQPLLVAAGLVSALALFPHPADAFKVVGAAAGHSVGEILPPPAPGVVSAERAMVLVRNVDGRWRRPPRCSPLG
jgi:[acyl-carrier-protein] S-malonyltransferase